MADVQMTERDLLEGILYELKKLNGRALAAAPLPPRPNEHVAPMRPGAAPEIADDQDLDGQWGNPQVRKDPPRWQGESYAGAYYADCPSDYLEALAGFLSWQAGKADEKNEMANNGKPRSGYLRKDAARARGWARRNQKTPARRPAPEPVPGLDSDDDVPFLPGNNR